MSQNHSNFLDELLYYLSHLGKMRWEKFKQGFESLKRDNKNPKSVSYYLRPLTSVGHMEYDPVILDWVYVAPATLVETATANQYILVGSRTPDLVSKIEETVLSKGGKFYRIPEVDAATTIFLRDLTELTIQKIEGMGIHISSEFSAKLSCILPNLQLDSFDEDKSILNASIEKFNTDTLRYDNNSSDISDGLYRILNYGRHIHFLKLNNIQRKVPREWGEWLILRAFRKSKLIRYEKEQQILQVRWPLTLPLLLNRCAVLCSGHAPKWKNGFYCYPNVPIEIASRIAKSLNQQLEE